jgi:integrase
MAGGDEPAVGPPVPASERGVMGRGRLAQLAAAVFQANGVGIGMRHARPYDLRHSFVSLLIQEGRTVIDVAQQAGHSAETCLRYYAHLFAELDPAVRVSAEAEIRRAREEAGGRSVDAGPDEAAAA